MAASRGRRYLRANKVRSPETCPMRVKRHVAPRIDYLPRGESDVVPCVSREQRVRLCHANSDEEPECGRCGQTCADVLQIPPHRPEVSEVFRACTRLQPDYDSEHD